MPRIQRSVPAADAGFDAHLVKPVEEASLLQVIERSLASSGEGRLSADRVFGRA